MTFEYWLDWSSWLFGIRIDWQQYRRFVVIELGPVGLCWEFDEPQEAPHD